MIDDAEAEGLAAWALRVAGLDDDAPPRLLDVARALDVEVLEAPLRTRGALARVAGRWRACLRPGLRPPERRWVLAHELAERLLAADGYDDVDVELAAARVGAALLGPRRWAAAGPATLPAWLALGEAARLGPWWAALRRAEASGRPTVLVTPRAARARGEPWGWPPPAELAALARRGRLPPGLRRERLPGGAVALVVDG